MIAYKVSLKIYLLSAIFVIVCFFTDTCMGLERDEILVVANMNAARSAGLAKYYMRKRDIPNKNLIKLWITDKELCSRSDYEKKVVQPIRRYILQNQSKSHIRCLLIMYGIPLNVSPPELSSEEKMELTSLTNEKNRIENYLKTIKKEKSDKEKKIKTELQNIKKRISTFNKKKDRGSSLDSEIALVLEENYSLDGWIPNPYYLGFQNKELSITKDKVLMVSRLDGLSDTMVKRIIDDSLYAEENGLKGKAYFDARWPDPGDKNVTGYGFYDKSIHRAADIVKESEFMPVVVNDTQELFKPGECSDAALYCGWYRLSRYVDAFNWQIGSVGYHIASGECTTLKNKNSQIWCKMMLEKGIAATIGPVSEPYVQAFPVPEIFFKFLTEGYLSIAECYLISTPYLSWKMVLVGDPLYRPFKKESNLWTELKR